MANFSADEIYALVSKHTLTNEQRAVIEGAPFDSPALVIAGAGSGKTELMSLRVLYLVANSLARPDEVLGLTFTRKAAAELSARVNQALYRLRETDFWPADLEQDFSPAYIATYNSFGDDIFRRLALSVGFEQDATLLTEAASVSLADELVRSLTLETHARLEDWEKSKSHLIDLVLALASELTDNQISAESMNRHLQFFIDHVSGLPKNASGSMERFAYTEDLLASAGQNQLLADLAEQYRSLKSKRNLVDFADQVALALKALEKPFEHQHRFVLLDEYQDTSTIQTKLLSRLFAGKSVLAVGDPNQAIYGWRGASSRNLTGFHQDFGSPRPVTFTLSKSWRSGPAVVAAANATAHALNLSQPELAPVTLEAGKPQHDDQVTAAVYQTEAEEAAALAQWFMERVDENTSAALLTRTKASMAELSEALTKRGLVVEVSGLSSLLELPEVMDLIAALSVIERPEAGAQLMRLLAGPKWRIGAKDLAALGDLAKFLSRVRDEVVASQPVTIVEALDELCRDSEIGNFSDAGRSRLIAAAQLIRRMRSRVSIPLSELAWSIVKELEIDIELVSAGTSVNPLSNLEAFIARIAEFEQAALRPTLGSMLNWLDHAKQRESFELPRSGAKQGVVQIMSIHAAKGLEWDVVAIAQLNQGSFPIEGRGAKGWLASGKVPFSLRGDSQALPEFAFQTTQTQGELKKLFDEFQDKNRAKHLIEERRLAYVGFTRAKRELHLTASYYKPGLKKPRPISGFLVELLESGLCRNTIEIPEPDPVNPASGNSQIKIWPFDPLGERRDALAQGAAAVSAAEPARLENFTEFALLLEERERNASRPTPAFPRRLSASALMRLIAEPEKFAESLVRPMPGLFSASAQAGTDFHALIEDWLLGDEVDIDLDDQLVKNFAQSRFASLEPKFVEQSIEIVLDGLVVVCKLDAVFETELGFLVVDWKSGNSPTDPALLEARAMQLALYRIALSKWLQVGVERVQACFYFAGDAKEVMPSRLPSEAELVEALTKARTARRG